MAIANMSPRKSSLLTAAMLALSLLLALLLYPAALTLVLMADTFAGDAEFLRQFLNDSRRQAVLTIMSDWARALPVALVIWGALRLTTRVRYTRILMAAASLLTLLLVILAFVPPYLPLIFGALLLSGVLFSLAFDWLLRKVSA